MLEIITLDQLGNIRRDLQFPYTAYIQSETEDAVSTPEFFTIGSGTAAVRDRGEWNLLGREVHDVPQIERHARSASGILHSLGLKRFLIQQAVPEALWFRGGHYEQCERVNNMVGYLRSGGFDAALSGWRGALIVKDDVGGFLECFLDYPFKLKYYDLQLFAIEAPLAMIISHHLSIEYISTDRGLTRSLSARIISEGILESPDRGLIA